jgi:anti-sigma factor RsiW
MYSCQDINQLLVDYLDESLPGETQQDLEMHLAKCKNCAKYLKTYRKTIELTGKLEIEKMPEELKKRLLDFLTRR